MADLYDVADKLVLLAQSAVYPSGIEQPSVSDSDIRIYQGWPIPDILNTDLVNGVSHISVFPREDERNTTRFPKDERELLVGVTEGTTIKPVKTQERVFQVTVWAPTPELRKIISSKIDELFADTPRIDMGDGSSAKMVYRGSPTGDGLQKSLIYRRDLLYVIEYTTLVTNTAYVIAENIVNISQL